VRALEQLGRAREALSAIDELSPQLAGADRDWALGLRWRAMVDIGEADRARVEADAWAQRERDDSNPDWRRAVAWLWGALAQRHAGRGCRGRSTSARTSTRPVLRR
jgi:hypothetical protein